MGFNSAFKGLMLISFFPQKIVAFQILCKDMKKPDRLQTHTHRMSNTYCHYTVTMVKRTRVKITLYVYCLSC